MNTQHGSSLLASQKKLTETNARNEKWTEKKKKKTQTKILHIMSYIYEHSVIIKSELTKQKSLKHNVLHFTGPKK